jgi:hypothetical protein
MTDDLFLHENVNQPENRINLAIFGLICVRPFREWLQQRLHLPPEAVLYPCTNLKGSPMRPDFVVRHATTEKTLAWIEVECGKDEAQLARFRNHLSEPVLAIWGRRTSGADLSLEEMAEFLDQLDTNDEPQVRWNAEHLRLQIVEALDGRYNASLPEAAVSEAMRETPFVRRMTELLGERLSFDVDRIMRPGEIRANTRKESGFSLRVYSRVAGQKSISVLNQTGGRPEIWFQSKTKMLRYLPNQPDAIDELAALVRSMGGDMESITEQGKTPVPLSVAEQHVEELARITLDLATP